MDRTDGIPLEVLRRRDLSDGAKLLYGLLCAYQRRTAPAALEPTVDELAEALGTSVRSVQRQIAALAAAGILERSHGGGGRGSRQILRVQAR